MRIIGLCGHAKCGKSATLNMLKELLREAGKSISSEPHPWCEAPETFEYKGMVVCVAPGGDVDYIIKRNIAYFKAKNCDIAISASRTKGTVPAMLNEFANSMDTKVEWIAKSVEYNLSGTTQDLCNHETARYLLSLIS